MRFGNLFYVIGLVVAIALFTLVPMRTVAISQGATGYSVEREWYGFLADADRSWTFYTPYSHSGDEMDAAQYKWQRIAAIIVLVCISFLRPWRGRAGHA